MLTNEQNKLSYRKPAKDVGAEIGIHAQVDVTSSLLEDEDSEAVVERRMRDAVAEMSHFDEYDYLVVNDNFGDAVNDLKSIICSVRLARQRQQHRYAALLRSLVAS